MGDPRTVLSIMACVRMLQSITFWYVLTCQISNKVKQLKMSKLGCRLTLMVF